MLPGLIGAWKREDWEETQKQPAALAGQPAHRGGAELLGGCGGAGHGCGGGVHCGARAAGTALGRLR